MKLREANYDDAEIILKIRNQRHVRESSFSTRPITLTAHIYWFERALENHNYKIYVALNDEYEVVGVIRAEIKLTNRRLDVAAEMSYYLDRRYCGKGMGTEMLAMAERATKAYDKRIGIYEAMTLAHNAASNKLLLKSGYKVWGVNDEKIHWTKSLAEKITEGRGKSGFFDISKPFNNGHYIFNNKG